jgi:hypothetical protein
MATGDQPALSVPNAVGEAIQIDRKASPFGWQVVILACRIDGFSARQRGELSATDGDDSARIESGLRWRFVGAFTERTVVQIAVAPKPGHGAIPHSPCDGVQVRSRGRRLRVKHYTRLCVAREHAIKHCKVEVNVEIQAAEALNEIDRTALAIHDSVTFGACPVAREDGVDEDAPQRCEHIGLEGGQLSKLVGQREDILAHRHIGKNPIDDGRRLVGHASARAARTHGTRFTRKGHKQVVPAHVATRPSEAFGEQTTLEIGA